jgi:hypothetical protein
VPAATFSTLLPPASNAVAAPPFTEKLKSETAFVPPLLLTTILRTVSVAELAMSLLVIVQVAFPPAASTTLLQPA